jgi:S1-C subfamily serine protease
MPADDDEASGPPPHPLDRVWFHPSELGSGTAATFRPQPASPRVWLVAALALLVGVSGTLGVVSAVGGFTDGADVTRTRVVEPALVDPDAVASLVSGVGRSIVTLALTPAGGGEATVAGSGVVIQADRVLTAAHLLTADTVPAVVTMSGQVGTVRIVGVDAETDLALLAVEGADLVPARLSVDETLQVGQGVAALGAGAGPDRTVGAGVISALERTTALPNGVRGSGLIETDARVEAGAAGGGLLDGTGAVIGILSGTGRTAVPMYVARDVAAQLDVNGRAVHGWSGIVGTDVLDRPGGGVRVRAVVAGSPAAVAAIQVDDVVFAIAGRDVATAGELVAEIRRLRPGDTVEITVLRAGKRIDVPLALGESVPTPADWLVVA